MINLDKDEDDVYDVIQEINTLVKLRAPQIIRCLEAVTVGTDMWLIMEFCGGGSCADLTRHVRALGEGAVAYIVRETLFGLRYLHREQMIHRDVKAANILLTAAGEVKLGDFGVSGQLTRTMTHKMTFVGTPFWMAPEIIGYGKKGEDDDEDDDDDDDYEDVESDGDSDGGTAGSSRRRRRRDKSGYNTKVDIWSLGITAYELAENGPPLAHMDPMKALCAIGANRAPTLPTWQYASGCPAYDSKNGAAAYEQQKLQVQLRAQQAQQQQQQQAQQVQQAQQMQQAQQKRRRLGILSSSKWSAGQTNTSGSPLPVGPAPPGGSPKAAIPNGTPVGSFGTSVFTGTWAPFSNSSDAVLACQSGVSASAVPEYRAPHEYSPAFRQFVTLCLQKDPRARPTCDQLLDTRFVQATLGAKGLARARTGLEDTALVYAQRQAMAVLIERRGVARAEYNRRRDERRRGKMEEKRRQEQAAAQAHAQAQAQAQAAEAARQVELAQQALQRKEREFLQQQQKNVLQPLGGNEQAGGRQQYPVKNGQQQYYYGAPQQQQQLPTPPLYTGHTPLSPQSAPLAVPPQRFVAQGSQITVGMTVPNGQWGVGNAAMPPLVPVAPLTPVSQTPSPVVMASEEEENDQGSDGQQNHKTKYSAMEVDTYRELMGDWDFPSDKDADAAPVSKAAAPAQKHHAQQRGQHSQILESIMEESFERVIGRARSAGVRRAVGEMQAQMRVWGQKTPGVVGALVEEIWRTMQERQAREQGA